MSRLRRRPHQHTRRRRPPSPRSPRLNLRAPKLQSGKKGKGENSETGEETPGLLLQQPERTAREASAGGGEGACKLGSPAEPRACGTPPPGTGSSGRVFSAHLGSSPALTSFPPKRSRGHPCEAQTRLPMEAKTRL